MKSTSTKEEAASTILQSLSDADIDKLIADHWREIKGLIKEMERRREQRVSNPDG